MPKQSAGVLLFRKSEEALQVFLVHPGGPFWSKKDDGAWTIPKGEFAAGEDPLSHAIRELREETGFNVSPPFLSLGSIRQAGGKIVHGFAAAAEVDPAKLVSNSFSLEWPPRSGRMKEFPEIDRAAWFPVGEATRKINPAQREFIQKLAVMQC